MGNPTRGQMLTHFDLALELRAHAINGDLARFRSAAHSLAELQPARDLPAEVFLQFGPLRYEARVGQDARTNEAASQAAAEIARTCGDCHAANEVDIPDAPLAPVAPAGAEDLVGHMDGLARVTGLLWAGLVGPSDASWQAGAAALIDAGALPEGLETRLPARDIDFASERLRRLGREASAAAEPEYRVRALSEIWATCSDCHEKLGIR